MDLSYVLMTDAAADLPASYYRQHKLLTASLTVTMDGRSFPDDAGQTVSYGQFYAALRSGSMPTTAMINMTEFFDAMEPVLQAGKDILYLAFTSGLSGTYANAAAAAAELAAKYPARTVAVVDTLCASLGQGLLVHAARKRRDAGASLEELRVWAEGNKMRVNHLVVVEDLMHLWRGGRVSRASAMVGSLIGIKPLLDVDPDGRLRVVGRHRGRLSALRNFIDRMNFLTDTGELGDVAVSHSDCQVDAETVLELIKERYSVGDSLINHIGATIGSHTGAGTVAVFFFGKPRGTAVPER